MTRLSGHEGRRGRRAVLFRYAAHPVWRVMEKPHSTASGLSPGSTPTSLSLPVMTSLELLAALLGMPVLGILPTSCRRAVPLRYCAYRGGMVTSFYRYEQRDAGGVRWVAFVGEYGVVNDETIRDGGRGDRSIDVTFSATV